MKTVDAFKLILQIEDLYNTNIFSWKDFRTWPLIRKIIWFRLISKNDSQEHKKVKHTSIVGSKILLSFFSLFKKTKINYESKRIFFSRPEYLQEVGSRKFVDRIVDPIIELHEIKKTSKYYFRNIPNDKKLIIKHYEMINKLSYEYIYIDKNQISILNQIAKLIQVDSLEFQKEYRNELHTLSQWFNSAKKLLSKHKSLTEVYVTCWYTTETMGICAAAKLLGIPTIDIQHGKQGQYQAMYSGWTKIPEEGYDLIPNKFWCWGKPSCDHILKHSPNRKHHVPFIGGFPWIDYYKKNIMVDDYIKSNEIRVLMTLQPPQGDNLERIPDFILRFLDTGDIENIHFIFRLHPNDTQGLSYCKERLKLITTNAYTIDFGKKNLYDLFGEVTHHITAYSSCSYEAYHFGIPTLLYGNESKEIYEYEIKEKIFSWTNSSTAELTSWLDSKSSNSSNIHHPYIEDTNFKLR